MSFGERLIEIRKKSGLTRKDLAERLNVPYTTLRNYETDTREPGHFFLIELSKLLNVSIDYLLGIESESKAEIFYLKINGKSMEPRMYEGDTLVVKRQDDVADGEIAVIELPESEVKVRKVIKQENGVLLVGLNSTAYTPRSYKYGEYKIIGKVIEVRGQMASWNKPPEK